MLIGLSERFRVRAALALAVAYAFCALAPSAAQAFAGGETAGHGVTDRYGVATVKEHGGKTRAHVSEAGAQGAKDNAQQPVDPSGKKFYQDSGCDAFCVSELAIGQSVALVSPVTASVDLFTVDINIRGRGHDRIHRPPIS